ncbi:MAG TPA: hypothetical protein PLZ43_14920 [bacterium]|nr:hypothetical protein [bacterium]
MKRGDLVTKEWLTAQFMSMFKSANAVDESQIKQLTSLQVFVTDEDGGTTYVSEKLSTLNNQYFAGIYELGTDNLLFQSLYDEIQKVL